MAIPLVIWGIVKVVGLAVTAYELYEVAKEASESIDKFEEAIQKARDYINEKMESLKEALNKNIDKKAEVAFLHALEKGDIKRQSETTKKALGRTFKGGPEIIAAIKQTIPFRKEISNVCALANQLPVIQIRKKDGGSIKGKDIKHIPHSKLKIIYELLKLTADELGAKEEIEGFVLVRLKQLVVSRLFELTDELLDWQSPFKPEACYGGSPNFDDPKLESGTKLLRKGTSINPFWPTPQGRGSISADITIPDYRKEPLSKTNTFALIEIKFQNDEPDDDQFDNYDKLSQACAEAKTGFIGLPRTNGKTGVAKGCRIALFRFPEDVAIEPQEDEEDEKNKNKNKKDDGNDKQKDKPHRTRGKGLTRGRGR
jgi:hypothetical protein